MISRTGKRKLEVGEAWAEEQPAMAASSDCQSSSRTRGLEDPKESKLPSNFQSPSLSLLGGSLHGSLRKSLVGA